MANTENSPEGQPLRYTVLAQRTPQHPEISIQFNDKPHIGEKFYYRGTEMTVTAIYVNQPHAYVESKTDPGNCDVCHFFHR